MNTVVLAHEFYTKSRFWSDAYVLLAEKVKKKCKVVTRYALSRILDLFGLYPIKHRVNFSVESDFQKKIFFLPYVL